VWSPYRTPRAKHVRQNAAAVGVRLSDRDLRRIEEALKR